MVTEDDLVERGARSMLESLGDASEYFTRSELRRRTRVDMEATFGLVFARANPLPVVIYVQPGSVAEKAGVQLGDELVEIDGKPASGLGPAELISHLARSVSGPVRLKMLSGPWVTRDIALERSRSPNPMAISCRVLGSNILYIALRELSFDAPGLIRSAASAAGEIGTRVILDLRAVRASGSFESAFAIVDLFVVNGVLGVVEWKTGMEKLVASEHSVLETAALITLVGGETEHGAEVIAAGLQDNRRGTILGTPTAGRVEVGSWQRLGQGDGVYLVTGRFRRADGRSFDKLGVVPDVTLSPATKLLKMQDVPCPGTPDLGASSIDGGVVQAVTLLRVALE